MKDKNGWIDNGFGEGVNDGFGEGIEVVGGF